MAAWQLWQCQMASERLLAVDYCTNRRETFKKEDKQNNENLAEAVVITFFLEFHLY